MAERESHGLGVGRGSIIDLGNGQIEYRQTGKIMPAFRVTVSDITGFATRKPSTTDKRDGASGAQQIFVILGGGTELASCAVNYGTAPKIEAWISAHPSFKGNTPESAAPAAAPVSSGGGLAEQLSKLAELRDAGVLSADEFDQAKAKLLS